MREEIIAAILYGLGWANALQSCPTLQSYGLQLSRLLCPWDSRGKNTGVSCHALLWGIIPTQGLNPHLLHLLYCKRVLYHQHHLSCYDIFVVIDQKSMTDLQQAKNNHTGCNRRLEVSGKNTVRKKAIINTENKKKKLIDTLVNFEGILKSYVIAYSSQKSRIVKECHNLSRKQIKMFCAFEQMLQYLTFQGSLTSAAVLTYT